MSKRNITFTKPEEPSFLKKLKKEAGYKEGPTVDTKRQDLGPVEDLSDAEDEQPVVVVLQEGDLTAEEAEREQSIAQQEIEETPADLSAPVVFKAREKKSVEDKSVIEKKSTTRSKSLLSFDEEEDDDC